jgi:hypothetical protein
VTEFHIGRSVDPQNRASKYQADEVWYLFMTASLSRAATVEAQLLRYFRRHPKNSDLRADGGGPTAAGTQHVYLALRLA